MQRFSECLIINYFLISMRRGNVGCIMDQLIKLSSGPWFIECPKARTKYTYKYMLDMAMTISVNRWVRKEFLFCEITYRKDGRSHA